jgi:large subunit ribosomal protein L9
MEVILLERVAKLGQMGETVRVKDGYARNFLLAKGKALRATKENKARFEGMRKELETKNSENRGEAEKISGKIDGKTFVVIRQASETGQLFGSVTTRDIAAMIADIGVTVTRNQIHLHAPIKMIGGHKVPVALHPEVEVSIQVNVARNEDEAARIARGEDVTIRRTADEEERAQAAANAEAFFEEGAKHEDLEGEDEKAEGEGEEEKKD